MIPGSLVLFQSFSISERSNRSRCPNRSNRLAPVFVFRDRVLRNQPVTARNFESKRIAMNFLGSLATVGNTITQRRSLPSSLLTPYFSWPSLISPPSAADRRQLKPGRIVCCFADNSANAEISAAIFMRSADISESYAVVCSLHIPSACPLAKPQMTLEIEKAHFLRKACHRKQVCDLRN